MANETLFEKKCELFYLVNTMAHHWTIQEVWEFLGGPNWDIDNDLDEIICDLSLDDKIKKIVWDALEKFKFIQKDTAEYLQISQRKLNYIIRMNGWKHSSWKVNR